VPWIVALPTLEGVKVTEQLEVVVFKPTSVQGDPTNEPDAVPLLVNATVPPGALGVPDAVSLTKAVQVFACPTTTVDGEQRMLVVVDLVPPTLTVLLVPVLAE